MLDKIGLEGRVPRPTACPKPVQHIMKIDSYRELAVQKAYYSLPKYLKQSNPPDLYAPPLEIKDHCLPHDLLGHCPITKLRLQYGNYLLPVGGIKCVVLSGINQLLSEVLHSHSQRSAQAVQANSA